MKKKQANQKFLKNEKGVITISFIIVLTIILFFILSFLGAAMTLSHVSVSQYMAYSAARKLSLGGQSLAEQREAARDYYVRLRGRFFKPEAFRGGEDWFDIGAEMRGGESGGSLGPIGAFTGHDSEEASGRRQMFYGAGLIFSSSRLKFHIPFLSGGAQSNYGSFFVTAFLGREPSREECQSFNKKRGFYIKALFQGLKGRDQINENLINRPPGDNGC